MYTQFNAEFDFSIEKPSFLGLDLYLSKTKNLEFYLHASVMLIQYPPLGTLCVFI